LLFGAEEHVDRWCARQHVPRGALVSLDVTWTLARLWYGNRLDPDWQRPTPREASAAFAAAGLHGDFWALDSA